MTTNAHNSELINEFVSSFGKFDEMREFPDLNPIAYDLRRGKPGKFGVRWRPRKMITSHSALRPLYEKLPRPFPPLYEELILTYRWAEVDLERLRLLANPRGKGLEGLQQQMFADSFLNNVLLSNGYVQFGKGPDYNFDPVCFDMNRNPGSQEFPVVRLDHEYILCDKKIVLQEELAPNFRKLVLDIITEAKRR